MKIKHLQLLNYSFLGFFLALMTSCSNEPVITENTSNAREKDYYLKLGKKLENPYSVTNMKKALESIKAKMILSKTAKSTSEFDIETSHLYVKIEPKNASEEALLKSDTSQVFFDYPLDYEFPEEVLQQIGTNDPDSIGSYYVSVPKDYVFPEGIKTEVIEELYIPEQDPYFDNITETGKVNKTTIKSKEDLLGNLLIEAYTLTNNQKQLGIDLSTTAKTDWWVFGSKWRPSGRITMLDNILNKEIPVEGAQVLIRQWFTVDNGITDANGYFSTGTIRGKAKYILQWERYDYSIRNGSFGQAETKSDYEKNDAWNFKITEAKDLYFATIHQAAYNYYYGNPFGLTSPPRNGFDIGTIQMKIAAREISSSSIGSSYSHLRSDFTLGLSPQTHIKAWGANSDRIYGTTIHELTHAAHSMVDRNSYDNLVRDAWTFPIQGGAVDNNKRLLETWARTIEIAMTLQRYRSKFGLTNYNCYKDNNRINYQNQTILKENHYTSAGYDMTDDFNQRVYGIEFPNDRVNGYTLKQLQDALVGAKSWSQWRDNIKNRYDNPTEVYLDELFNNWSN